MDKFVLYIPESIQLSDEQLLALCERNSDLRIETDVDQNLIIMSPTGGKTGNLNAKLMIKFGIWYEQSRLGELFDSSTGFLLPDGTIKSPDIAFLCNEKFYKLTEKDLEGFIPAVPDFALELRSRTDSRKDTEEKMNSYMENGCKLGWLIDPLERECVIFRSGETKETNELTIATEISGEDVLSGFVLKWRDIDGRDSRK